MDARLRKRRGILRVSTSRHIDCSVRRRPFGSTPFYAALANSFLAASALQMRPPSGWMRCTPQPYLQQPRSLWARQPSSTVLAMRRTACSALARRAPSSPYPSTSGGKSLILKRVAENRAPYSRFRFQDVSKTATHSEMFEKPPLISRYLLNREVFRAAFTFLRRLSPHLHFSKLIEIGTLNLKSSSSQIINPL